MSSERHLYLIFFMSLSGIRQVYFQRLLHGLKYASEAFILGLVLEILPRFNSENSRKCVLTTVRKRQEVGTRCFSP